MPGVGVGVYVGGPGDSVAAAPAFSPTDLSPLVYADAGTGLFSAADGGGSAVTSAGDTVQSWTNQGSAGGFLSKLSDANGPKLRLTGATPYLEFDSAANQRALTTALASAGSGDMTVALLCRHEHTAAGQAALTLWTTAGTANGASGGMAATAVERDYNWSLGYDSADGYATTSRPPLLQDGSWHLCVWRRTAGTPSTWDVFLDGQKISTGTTATTATVARFGVGGPMYGVGLAGGVAAAFVKRAALSDAEVAQLWDYYKVSPLVSQHSGKGLVVLGDSVSTWTNAATPWASYGTWLMPRGLVWQYGSYLQTNNGLGRIYNNSYGGKLTSQHTNEAVRIAAWANTFTASVDFVVATGVNGIRAGGADLTAAQEYAAMVALKAAVSALVTGPTQRWWLATPQDGNPVVYPSPYQTRLTALRALIAGNADGFGVIDTSGVPTGYLWGTGGRADTLFFGDPVDPNRDGLHPLATGMDDLAAAYQAAIGGVM